MGVLLYIQSAAFIDDIHVGEKNGSSYEEEVVEGYHASAINCWGAAGVYVITFVISLIQVIFNFKK
jgi:hypothetical protein